jgi:hypothetical protein
MGIGFIDRWRARHGHHPGRPAPDAEGDQASMAELLSDCELLREFAERAGLRLDDEVPSLSALDQLLPSWRDDPETAGWLGNDAGYYLGTVVVRTVPGARWQLAADGSPLVELSDGRQLDVAAVGHSWARTGTPQLTAAYLETTDH